MRASSTRHDGSYAISYTPKIAGLWTMSVMLGGAHADGSPFHVLIIPGPTNSHASIAVGEGTSKAAIGEKTLVILRTKDKHGNDRGVGGDMVSRRSPRARRIQSCTRCA